MESSLKRKRNSAYITPRSHRSRPNPLDAAFSQGQRRNNSRIRFSSPQGPSESRQRPDNARETGADNRSFQISTDDDLDQVIVAIDVKESATVGCAYYSAEEEKLYLLGDIRSAGAETIDSCEPMSISATVDDPDMHSVIFQTKPTVLLTSTRVDHLNRKGPQTGLENGN